MIRLIFALVLAFFSHQLLAASPNTSSNLYHLGIFPYMAPRQTVEFFGPVATSMAAELHHEIKLESMPNFADFTRAIKQHKFDIVLIQPFDYPEVVEKMGYVPIAQLSVPLVTQFFVRDDSSYRTIEDLRFSTIAMPPAQSANARMALRALHDNKLIPDTDVEVHYFNSHDSCIQQVWVGSASACTTAQPPILVFEQRMQAKLRAIYDTPSIPHAMFVTSPSMPAEQRAKLQKLITGWSGNENGRAILKGLGSPGFIPARPDEYAMMRNYDPSKRLNNTAPSVPKDLVLGVFPFLSVRQIVINFAPALTPLSKSVGMSIHLRTASSFDAFDLALQSTNYDIVIVQPFDYANAVKYGYLPIAGMQDSLEGVFYVRDDSPYWEIADFRGKIVAMPPVNSAQSHLGCNALVHAGLIPGSDVSIDYRLNHDSCLQQVQRGDAVACVTAERTLAMLPKEASEGLRIVGKTIKVPGVLFMVHKRIQANIRKHLQEEIIAWKDTDNGRKILLSMGFGELVPVNPLSYQNMPKF